MKRLMILMTLVASLLVRCQECPAQVLGTNQSSGDVTLTNMAWRVALTNASGVTPLLTTIYNFGPGGIEYQWGATNAPDVLPPGSAQSPAFLTVGPQTPVFSVLFWRCNSNSVSATGRAVRKLAR